jgi:hypothetical protein
MANATAIWMRVSPASSASAPRASAASSFGLEQVLDMIVATIHGDTGYTGPILQAALDGLRPPADAKPA